MSYKDRIPGCFGDGNLKFGSHELDLQRGVELLAECIRTNVCLRDLKAAVSDFLTDKGAGPEHIKSQLARVERCFSGWLD